MIEDRCELTLNLKNLSFDISVTPLYLSCPSTAVIWSSRSSKRMSPLPLMSLSTTSNSLPSPVGTSKEVQSTVTFTPGGTKKRQNSLKVTKNHFSRIGLVKAYTV